jgi:hypothetical protein
MEHNALEYLAVLVHLLVHNEHREDVQDPTDFQSRHHI